MKLLNTRSTLVVILSSILLSFTTLFAQTMAWPLTPFDQNHQITGNFAEYRDTGTSDHFHNGTDIPKADGSPVYPVKSGIVTSLSSQGSSAFVRVQDVAYVHIAPNPALSIGDSVFVSQTVLGTILPGSGHVHFTNGFVGSEKNSLLPINGFEPYSDPWAPIIRFVRFYQNNTTNQFPSNALSGLVDIVVKVDEQNGPPGSSTAFLNNGTYQIGYKILSADTSTVVFEPPNNGVRFKFDTKPSNSWVSIVYFSPLSSTTSHVYQVTNNLSSDNFWNTAALPVDDYVVMVFTADTRGNTDTAYVAVQTTESDFTAPPQPDFRIVKEIPDGMRVAWNPSNAADLVGYRLFFSFDNQNWSLFRDENVYTASVSDTTIPQILNRDIYFRLSAVDDAPVPNESDFSDVYGMSNGDFAEHKVLLVDGFDRTDGGWASSNHSFAYTYGAALMANAVSFDTAPNESVENDLVNLADYDAIFWFVGDESAVDETFSETEQTKIKTYLENGGNLFVSGSEIAWDLAASDSATTGDSLFLSNYLKASFAADSAGAMNVTGSAGSVFDGLDVSFGQIPYPVPQPDVINPNDGAIAALKYDDTQIASIQYDGIFGNGTATGKLIYLAFPFETIANAQARNDVLSRVADFFFGVTAIHSGDAANGLPGEFALLPNYPNPFNPSTTLRFDLPVASYVRLEIFNAIGQKIRTLQANRLSAGRHQIQWNGQSDDNQPIPSGVYFVRLNADGVSTATSFQKTQKMLLIK